MYVIVEEMDKHGTQGTEMSLLLGYLRKTRLNFEQTSGKEQIPIYILTYSSNNSFNILHNPPYEEEGTKT